MIQLGILPFRRGSVCAFQAPGPGSESRGAQAVFFQFNRRLDDHFILSLTGRRNVVESDVVEGGTRSDSNQMGSWKPSSYSRGVGEWFS